VRYRALDIVRRHAREVPGYEPEDRADDAPDALTRLVSTAEDAALHRCMDQLDQDRRQLVVMAFVDGLSHSELADRLKVPLGTVKSWIRRSLLSLRECLAA
jgi:RNA polymerase sigma factor (sigma-70 family)